MARKPGKTIEELLAERQQFELWLNRLEERTDLASEKVRDKIRADYQHRLDSVIDKLRSHADNIADQLAEKRVAQSELGAKEEVAVEELAEAEVRHEVGEYNDEEWVTLKAEGDSRLEAIRHDLHEVNQEIDHLTEVQGLIASPPATDEPSPIETVESTSAIGKDDVVPMDTNPEAPQVGAPTFTPRGAEVGGEPSAPRTLRFPTERRQSGETNVDELDFLKSVSEDVSAGPSPRRASGGHQATERTPSRASTKATGVASPSGDPARNADDAATQSDSKTLKCAECGELNRPTEWYCERCGAELASL